MRCLACAVLAWVVLAPARSKKCGHTLERVLKVELEPGGVVEPRFAGLRGWGSREFGRLLGQPVGCLVECDSDVGVHKEDVQGGELGGFQQQAPELRLEMIRLS